MQLSVFKNRLTVYLDKNEFYNIYYRTWIGPHKIIGDIHCSRKNNVCLKCLLCYHSLTCLPDVRAENYTESDSLISGNTIRKDNNCYGQQG